MKSTESVKPQNATPPEIKTKWQEKYFNPRSHEWAFGFYKKNQKPAEEDTSLRAGLANHPSTNS